MCCISIAKLVKWSAWHTVCMELELDFSSWTPSVNQTLENKMSSHKNYLFLIKSKVIYPISNQASYSVDKAIHPLNN